MADAFGAAKAAVCICTRARPVMLRRCLASLRVQALGDAPLQFLIIVVDNDPAQSARPVFDEVIGAGGEYLVCAEPGIPFARNAALDAALAADADFIAFIDDDEVAPPNWLQTLFLALLASGADAAQGEVQQVSCPEELKRRGLELLAASPQCEPVESIATCNTLFKASLAKSPLSLRFDEAMRYTGGSDKDYFMRAHKAGARVVRVRGAQVIEEVAQGRETLSYAAMRAFAAGNNYQLRMSKNESATVAFRRVAGRVVERGFSGTAKLVFAGLLSVLLQWRSAERQLRRGSANLSFALGCLAPLVGLRAHPYRVLQGT